MSCKRKKECVKIIYIVFSICLSLFILIVIKCIWILVVVEIIIDCNLRCDRLCLIGYRDIIIADIIAVTHTVVVCVIIWSFVASLETLLLVIGWLVNLWLEVALHLFFFKNLKSMFLLHPRYFPLLSILCKSVVALSLLLLWYLS